MLPAMNKGRVFSFLSCTAMYSILKFPNFWADPCNKEESSGWDADEFVAEEGLDTLPNLAIQGEGEGPDFFREQDKTPTP